MLKDGGGDIFSAVKVSLLAGVAMIGVSPAFAQDAAEPASGAALTSALIALPVAQAPGAAQEAAPLENEVVVTGSLVAKNGFDMPTPVTVITEEDIAQIGAPDISDVINQIPSVRASLTNDSTANQSSAAGGTFADLRGLGAPRTLVMVDGRRWSPTNGTGAVSTAALPQAALSGVDIVTGGASATYGSDAVAGVINYKINDRLEGFKGRVQGGISDYGDYENYLASVAYGTKLLDDRARLIVAGEISDNRGIRYASDRAWADNVLAISNPAYTDANDEPRLLLVSGVRYANRTDGGVITGPTAATTAGLTGLMFMPDGSAVPMAYGTLRTTSTMVGGSGADRSSKTRGTVPQNRRSLFGRLTVDATDSFSFFVEGNYALLKSEFENVTGTETVTIRRENPYLPQSVRDVMIARNIASLSIGRTFEDNRREIRNLNVETKRFIAGAEGSFGDSWNWDAYYSGGWTDNTSHRLNSRVVSKFDLAIDAVINPANGAIVCRSTLTDPTNGCVPMNLIGYGNASEEALRYTNADGVHSQLIAQHIVAAKVRGEPFSTWAGPVGVAVGAEHKWLSIDAIADPLSAGFAFAAGGYTPWAGKVTVKEAFGELLVPLAKDASWAKNLSLNLAARATDYSTSGLVYTWKAGVNYSPNDALRFRATRSRDIRAPSLEELFLGGSSASGSVTDPVLQQTYSTTIRNTGNPFLTPEIADTFTAGVIFSPEFARGFQLSVDYWDIKLDQAIVNLTGGIIVRQCYVEMRDPACQLITRGPNPGDRIQYVVNGPINFEEMSARGLDFEMSYRTQLGRGRLNLRAMATYFHRGYIISNETGVRELHDSVEQGAPKAIGGNPYWKGSARITYSVGGKFISLAGRYVGGGRITPGNTYKDLNILRVNGRLYLDASAEYPLIRGKGDSVVLFGSVRNLLNTDPPITGESSFATTRALYDVVGRVYSGGVKFRF